MSAHVIWLGPVSREQRAGATLEGAQEHFLPCTGDGAGGTPRCRALAESLRDSDGRHLPSLLPKLGISEGEDIYLGAFSAGGSAVKVLLSHPDDRAAIRAVMLADATYELRGSDRRPAPSPSLVDYAIEALSDGSKMLVATASTAPNNRLGTAEPSGAETLARIAADIESRSGQRFDQTSHLEGVDGLRAARVWRRGSVVLGDFGGDLRHEEHATTLAPIMWSRVLAPWVAERAAKHAPRGRANQDAHPLSTAGVFVGLGVAVALALGIARASTRRDEGTTTPWRRQGR